MSNIKKANSKIESYQQIEEELNNRQERLENQKNTSNMYLAYGYDKTLPKAFSNIQGSINRLKTEISDFNDQLVKLNNEINSILEKV